MSGTASLHAGEAGNNLRDETLFAFARLVKRFV
jgi:hypothetical protein